MSEEEFVMEPVHHHDRGQDTAPVAASPRLSTTVVVMLLVFDVLLMAFSVVMWRLGNETLAATVGAAATALTVDVARRLLAVLAQPSAVPAPDARAVVPVPPAEPPGPQLRPGERMV